MISARDPDHPRTWPTLEKVVELFVLMGCERQPPSWEDHARLETVHDRAFFLVNPDYERAFVHVLGMTDDEWVPPSLVEQWEARLRTAIPHHWPDPDRE